MSNPLLMGFDSALREFSRTLTENFALPFPAQPEDQLKGPVQDLLRAAGRSLGKEISTRTETSVSEVKGRPDIGVAVQRLLCGYVELKAPGKGARPEKFTGSDLVQWKKFKEIPNLIYTDGSSWALYRSGKLERLVRFSGEVTRDGTDAVSAQEAQQLLELLSAFFSWDPIVPKSPPQLAELLAPLCRLLRTDVLAALQNPDSNLSQLAKDWRRVLFPDADDAQFADAYAQTLTYALLLARLNGQKDVRTSLAADALEKGYGLLAQTLRILTDPEARKEIALGVELLERSIGALDPKNFEHSGNLWVDAHKKRIRDLWLYFYEDFLAAYDPKLRNDRGVYYTPVEVIHAQCQLVSHILEESFEKRLSFADKGVILLDPATGTGAYPLAAMQMGLDKVAEEFGQGVVGSYATSTAQNTYAFEILVGPYAVAHLRLTQQILDAGGRLPEGGTHVYLTDTLESPFADPKNVTRHLPLMHKRLAEEHRKAQKIKEETRVLVCIGNPPYDRQQIDASDQVTERKGGWVRFGDKGHDPILEDFLAPVRDAGMGVTLKNVYNDYVYFWRWALWKVFQTTSGPGVLSFITAASYLRGTGFLGMRKVMRELLDELWIIDLEGSNLGARKTQNVFNIQTPVAIAIGVRYGDPDLETPAKVHYTKITGTREEKLERLNNINKFSDLPWADCYSDWSAPFLPKGDGDYFTWPRITDIFPWQHSGAQFKRKWPIGETAEVLKLRWKNLLSLSGQQQKVAFKETRDRKTDRQYPSITEPSERLPAISSLPPHTPCLEPIRYGFRSFDRQWVIPDARVGDFLRPPLWQSYSSKQVFMTSLLTDVLGLGPATVVTGLIPDMHHFSNRGAKDVIPLWRDSEATEANITGELLENLEAVYEAPVSPEDLFAYTYALMSSPLYVERFSNELEEPGPRVPITKDYDLFSECVGLGRELIWLHTIGERYVPKGQRAGQIPRGSARNTKPISEDPKLYPETFSYDSDAEVIRVGFGEFAPVLQAVWDFSVSGLQVLYSWLSYRMKAGAGRTSSPLDKIRPTSWPSDMTVEFLQLLWVLERTVHLFPQLETNLSRIIEGEVFSASELPMPSEHQRHPPVIDTDEEDTGQQRLPVD